MNQYEENHSELMVCFCMIDDFVCLRLFDQETFVYPLAHNDHLHESMKYLYLENFIADLVRFDR